MRLIDADKLIDQIDIIRLYLRDVDDKDQLSGVVVKRFIQAQPTVKCILNGMWDHREGNIYRCSQCGHHVDNKEGLPNYCPNCGAKMDKE